MSSTPMQIAEQYAKAILNDISHVDPKQPKLVLEGVTHRVFVAMKDSARAALAVGSEAPAARAERLHLFGQMLNALCRDPRGMKEVQDYGRLAQLARQAHEAFAADAIAQPAAIPPSQGDRP